MLMHSISAALLWTLAAVFAFAVCAVWIADAQSGVVSAWVVLPFFWSAAVLAVVGHHLAQWLAPLSRAPPAPFPTSDGRRTARLTAMNGTASEPNG